MFAPMIGQYCKTNHIGLSKSNEQVLDERASILAFTLLPCNAALSDALT
jgi:hypothetical protein